MNTLPILLGGTLNKDAVLANVARWRRAHGLGAKQPKFTNSPRIVTKKPVTIDIQAKVEVVK